MSLPDSTVLALGNVISYLKPHFACSWSSSPTNLQNLPVVSAFHTDKALRSVLSVISPKSSVFPREEGTMSTPDALALSSLLESFSIPGVPVMPASSQAPSSARLLEIARLYLADILTKLDEHCTSQTAYSAIVPPADVYAGDFAVILPKLLGRGKADWNVVGFELCQKFPKHPLFNHPFAEGVHLRVWLNTNTLYQLAVPFVLQYGENFGFSAEDEINDQKFIILEFSSPNLATAFSARHLRSTIHGLFLSNLYTSFSHPIHKINYFGDWGKNLALLGVAYDRQGNSESVSSATIAELESFYKKIDEEFQPENQASKKARDDKTGEEADIESKGLFKERNDWFTALEKGEPAQKDFFTRVRELYIQHYTKLYARIGVSFDSYSGESTFKTETLAEVESLLKEKGLLEEGEGGSLVVDLKKHGKDKKVKSGMCIIRDRGGSSTYLSRELAGVLERSRSLGEAEVDKLVYVVESAHHGVHFSRIQVLLELMGLDALAAKVQHVGFAEPAGLEELEATPGGLLENLLSKVKEEVSKTLQENEEKASVLQAGEEIDPDVLATNVLLVQELTTRRASDHILDIHKAASFDNGTALTLQYWLARLKSIANDDAVAQAMSDADLNDSLEGEDQNILLRLLVQFPEVTSHALKSLEATGVVAYLATVAGQAATCLEPEDDPQSPALEGQPSEEPQKVEEAEEQAKSEITPAEIKLYKATKIVLQNGLRLLGFRGI